jgi:hypothetical protein
MQAVLCAACMGDRKSVSKKRNEQDVSKKHPARLVKKNLAVAGFLEAACAF